MSKPLTSTSHPLNSSPHLRTLSNSKAPLPVPCMPSLGLCDDFPSVWSAQPSLPPHTSSWPIFSSHAQVDSWCRRMPSLFAPIRSASSYCWKPLAPFVCLSKLSYLSYGIKHFPPSTLMSCTCYTRLNYFRGRDSVVCFLPKSLQLSLAYSTWCIFAELMNKW